jgi:hypothetical protein
MKKTKKTHLVYKVTNQVTGEAYIGATTKSIEERKADHIQKANKGTGSYFQEAMATYRPEDFVWEQIDTANSVNELAEKEKQYILKYNSKEQGYNSDSGGGFKKIVYQFNEDGVLIASYDGLKEVETTLNYDKRRISTACTNATLWKGSFWSYSQDSTFNNVADSRKKRVFQYNYNGELVAEFVSVAEASRITGLSKTCISRCCRGEREQSGGFIWKYI